MKSRTDSHKMEVVVPQHKPLLTVLLDCDHDDDDDADHDCTDDDDDAAADDDDDDGQDGEELEILLLKLLMPEICA